MPYANHISLAWKMLSYKKRRLVLSVGTVTFAVMIMFMEYGFFNGLMDSQASFPAKFDADLVMIAKEKEPIDKLRDFLRVELERARALSEVTEVTPVYECKANFKNPQTKRIKTIHVIAFPVGSHPFHLKELDKYEDILKQANTILFDARSRGIFGQILERMEVEIDDSKFKVGGLFEMGPTFVRDGYCFMGVNAWKRLKGADSDLMVSYGLIRLEKTADLVACQQKLAKIFSLDISIKTPEQIIQQEIRTILLMTPTGALFGIGLVLGFVIGAIICYQLLYNEITDHIAEYATLKAMGFPKGYLHGIVHIKANLLSVIGFLFGLLASFILYKFLQNLTDIIMTLNPERILFVFGLTVLMCNLAGILSVKKVLDIDPAEIF